MSNRKALVLFSLPEGMTEQDLFVLLKDALDDFRFARAEGCAAEYAHEVVSAQAWYEERELGETWSPEKTTAEIQKKTAQVQQRFDWTRHFQSDARHMRVLSILNDD